MLDKPFHRPRFLSESTDLLSSDAACQAAGFTSSSIDQAYNYPNRSATLYFLFDRAMSQLA